MRNLRTLVRALILESQTAPHLHAGTDALDVIKNEGIIQEPGMPADYQAGFDDFYTGSRVAVYRMSPNAYHLNPKKPKLIEKWIKDASNIQVYPGTHSYSELTNGHLESDVFGLGPAKPRNEQYMKGWTTAAYVCGFRAHSNDDRHMHIDELYGRPSKRKFNTWKKSIFNKNGRPITPLSWPPGNIEGSVLVGGIPNPLHGIPNAEYGIVKTSHLGIDDHHSYWEEKGRPVEDHPTLSSMGFVKA